MQNRVFRGESVVGCDFSRYLANSMRHVPAGHVGMQLLKLLCHINS